MADEDEVGQAFCDTGSGRWFVLTRTGTEWSLIAGPYQTDAAMERWMESYKAPAGVDHVQSVRCEGTWRDAITHADEAMAHTKQAIAKMKG